MTYKRRTLIIGCGNSLRQDDGVGYATAQQLATLESKDSVRVIACQQLTPELAMEIGSVERVIVVDATTVGSPGCISVQRVQPKEQNDAVTTHELLPSTLLEYARVLYSSTAEMYLFTVSGLSFGVGSEFSEPVQTAMPKVHRLIQDLLNT